MKNEYSDHSQHLLRFGIPSLDELFGGRSGHPGIDCGVDEPNIARTSICITGPDGTGKSVLALHLASYYAASQFGATQKASIIYVSTDLTHPKAQSIWKHFALDYPLDRPIPFSKSWRTYLDRPEDNVVLEQPIELKRIDPSSTDLSQKLFNGGDANPFVAFVDLASRSAGDDWGLVAKIVSLVEASDVPHLIVLDAIEGLEAYVGDIDAYGLQRSRRSRVAQVLRAASQKSHVCLVVEESNESSRLAEDYICDVVLRLRSTHFRIGSSQHLRRTIEIEKARAQAHARGQHSFSVRDGRGSKTGTHYHPSDPCVAWVRKDSNLAKQCLERWQNDTDTVLAEKEQKKEGASYIAYVQIFPSLEFLRSRAERTVVKPLTPEQAGRRAGFGIAYLDDMLPLAKDSRDLKETDYRGLSFGTTTILVGEDGTHRGELVRAFLGQCFAKGRDKQVAISFHFKDVSAEKFAEEVHAATGGEVDASSCLASNMLICQKLPIRDSTSGSIYHIVLSAIREAKRRLGVPDDQREPRIRLVLSNTTGITAAYPDVLEDHLFLLALTDMLNMEGVTSLLVHTDSGGPSRSNQNQLTQQLHWRGEHRIYTWHVPFFGEDRVAIAAIPPIALERSGIIRELKVTEEGVVQVDPHFEMYSGLVERRSESKLVPLRIRLWSREERFQEFMRLQNSVLKEVFSGMEGDIVSSNADADYDAMRSVMHLRGDTKLNDTLVVQIDDFWRAAHNELLPMAEYLSEPTCSVKVVGVGDEGVEHFVPIPGNDPSQLFQPTMNEGLHPQIWRTNPANRLPHLTVGHEYTRRLSDTSVVPRALFFQTQDYDCLSASAPEKIDRVPYTWDFGMMMLKSNAWEAAKDLKYSVAYTDPRPADDYFAGFIPSERPFKPAADQSVGKLCRRLREGKAVSWREFLRASASVARMRAGESADASVAFDVDMTAPESLNCLVLEVWASTIREMDPYGPQVFAKRRDDEGFNKSLFQLINEHQQAFYRAWLLLGEALAKTQFGNDWFQAESRPSLPGAVAARHWYSTASCLQSKRSKEDPLEVVRLPGNYSVRGDWFLGIAHGSLSPRLGQRAIDLLCSRRANAARLQEGIGLPTRDLGDVASVGNLRSALIKYGPKGKNEPITYAELIKMGKESASLDWLWRFTIPDYDRHAGIFLKMNLVLLAKCGEYWSRLSAENPHLRSGYQAYDYLRTKRRIETQPKDTRDRFTRSERDWTPRRSYRQFVEDCEPWLQRLKVASRRGD